MFLRGKCLGVGAVALFVFLSGAAWARVVAAPFLAGSAGRCAVAVGCGGADGAGLLEFALFFLVEFALEGVDGGRWSAVGYRRGYGLARSGSIGMRGRAACREGAGGFGSGELLLELRLCRGCCHLSLRLRQLLGRFDGSAVGADDL